jgi:hypothetical protein
MVCKSQGYASQHDLATHDPRLLAKEQIMDAITHTNGQGLATLLRVRCWSQIARTVHLCTHFF